MAEEQARGGQLRRGVHEGGTGADARAARCRQGHQPGRISFNHFLFTY